MGRRLDRWINLTLSQVLHSQIKECNTCQATHSHLQTNIFWMIAQSYPKPDSKTKRILMLQSFSHLETKKFLIYFIYFFFGLVCLHGILKGIGNDDRGITKTLVTLLTLIFVFTWILFNLRRPGKTLGELLGLNITFSKLEVIAISIGKFLLVSGFTILALQPLFGFEGGDYTYSVRHKLGIEHFPFDLITFVKLVILAPLGEELFFRGFLLQKISNRWGLKAGLLISTVVFAVVHPNMFSGLIAGLLTALIYIKTQNIFAPILYHSLHNILVVFKFFLFYGIAKLESLLHINVSFTSFGLIQFIPGVLITGYFIFQLWPVLNESPDQRVSQNNENVSKTIS